MYNIKEHKGPTKPDKSKHALTLAQQIRSLLTNIYFAAWKQIKFTFPPVGQIPVLTKMTDTIYLAPICYKARYWGNIALIIIKLERS